jgi:hypothetical protein
MPRRCDAQSFSHEALSATAIGPARASLFVFYSLLERSVMQIG